MKFNRCNISSHLNGCQHATFTTKIKLNLTFSEDNKSVRGNTHMTYTLKGRGEGGKNEMLSEVGGGGLASVLDVQSSFFY